MKIILVTFLFSFGIIGRINAQSLDSIPDTRKFELSFGNSLLFISHSDIVSIRTQKAIIIPTSAMLLLAEFRPAKRFRIPVFVTIPLESKQFLVNGLLVNERASPTFGTGFQFLLYGFAVGKKVGIEFEAGGLGSCLFTETGQPRFAPVGAGRMKIIKEKNFVMYLGSSYSFGINAFSLLYGTGFAF
ncbi:MAG TPA: hypothetical protein VI731_01855 [Bacteroidia bacterium]|nr:hypothetical protein [Bacteroidia bacterium]